jgi:hypothetical protein
MRQTRQEAMYEYMQKQQREAMYNDYYFEMQNRQQGFRVQQAPYFDRRSPPPWQPRQQGQRQQHHVQRAYASDFPGVEGAEPPQPTRQHNSGQHHRSVTVKKTDQLKKNDDKNDREDGEVKKLFKKVSKTGVEGAEIETKEEDDLYEYGYMSLNSSFYPCFCVWTRAHFQC